MRVEMKTHSMVNKWKLGFSHNAPRDKTNTKSTQVMATISVHDHVRYMKIFHQQLLTKYLFKEIRVTMDMNATWKRKQMIESRYFLLTSTMSIAMKSYSC